MTDIALANQVVRIAGNNPQQCTILMPAFVRFSYKKITDLNIEECQAHMSGSLLISIYYGGLDESIVKHVESNLEVSLNDQEFHSIVESTPTSRGEGRMHINRDKKNNIINVTWRSQFPLELSSSKVFFSPFDTIDLQFTVSLRSVKYEHKGMKHLIQFVLMRIGGEKMKIEEKHQMLSLSADHRGQFSMVLNHFDVQIVAEEEEVEEKEEKEEKVKKSTPIAVTDCEADSHVGLKVKRNSVQLRQKHEKQDYNKIYKKFEKFQTFRAVFHMYRHPASIIITIFLPLLIISTLNLAVFFQDNSLAGRIAAIATILVAYVAFLPTIRERIPPTPEVTAMDIILVLLCTNGLLCLLRSLLDRDISPADYSYIWNEDPIFMICLLNMIVNFTIVAVGCIVFKTKLERDYIKGVKSNKRSDRGNMQWKNPECEESIQKIKQERPDSIEILWRAETKKVIPQAEIPVDQLKEMLVLVKTNTNETKID